METKLNLRNYKTLLIAFLAVLIIVFGALITYRLVSGRSLGLRSFAANQIYSVKDRALMILNSSSVTRENNGEYSNIVFLHHSTGDNLIRQGDVREILSQSGYQFWDHNYNHIGIRGPDGELVGYSYSVPGDNTDPDGLVEIFRQRSYEQPLNTFSALLQHEVIAFKSCFPASDITDKDQLEEYKTWYLGIRNAMDQHPEKIFIVFTPPPLNPASTRPEIAANARAFSNWLKSEEYTAGHPNVFVFDFFNLLAEDDSQASDFSMLREEYREGSDSHPNPLANETIGPVFAQYLIDVSQQFRVP